MDRGREKNFRNGRSISRVPKKEGEVVRQTECRTNAPYVVDSIQLCLHVKYIENSETREHCLNKGFSTNQIASSFRGSRAVISRRLPELGIQTGTATNRSTNPQNNLYRVPPYGCAAKAGRLIPSKAEIKICRFVLETAGRKKDFRIWRCQENSDDVDLKNEPDKPICSTDQSI